MGKNLYEILEVEEDANPVKIKSAFLRLKHQYEQGFSEHEPEHISNIQYQAISEAFLILSTPLRRQLYDQRLINDRQNRYLTDSPDNVPQAISITKAGLFLLLVVVGIAAYFQYQHMQAEQARELQRIQLEQEQARLKQEEAKQAAEEAKQEQEAIKAQRQEAILREIDLMQNRAESRRYAAEVERAQELKRRQALDDQRRQEAERQRTARYTPVGPVFMGR